VICSLLLDGALGVDLKLDWPLPEGEDRVNMIGLVFASVYAKRSPRAMTIGGVIYVVHDAHLKAHAGSPESCLPTCFNSQSSRDCPLSRIWPCYGLYTHIHMGVSDLRVTQDVMFASRQTISTVEMLVGC
jgi:hypothetical protein